MVQGLIMNECSCSTITFWLDTSSCINSAVSIYSPKICSSHCITNYRLLAFRHRLMYLPSVALSACQQHITEWNWYSVHCTPLNVADLKLQHLMLQLHNEVLSVAGAYCAAMCIADPKSEALSVAGTLCYYGYCCSVELSTECSWYIVLQWVLLLRRA